MHTCLMLLGWMQPVRHALGALLLERGQIGKAADVYRLNLERLPRNVWGLEGLKECLERADRVGTEEYRSLLVDLKGQREAADIDIRSSCFCRKREKRDGDIA